MYRIRVILDTEEDVIRDLDISPDSNFKDLHVQILKAFDLEEGEMASFFMSNEDWEQGEEISLVDFGALSGTEAKLMENILLKDMLVAEGDKMIYVYDFLNLWTFYIDLLKISDTLSEASIIKVVGERPEEAPKKTMEIPDPEMDLDDNMDFPPEEDYFDINLN